MFERGSRLRLHERIDTFVSKCTGNKIKEQQLGPMKITIHERKRGRWKKVFTSHSTTPMYGKTHDIVYTVFEWQRERTRFGKMAKEQRPLTTALKK